MLDFLQTTFLIERFIGVFAYASFLYYFYLRIKSSKSKKQIRNLLFVYACILSIMAFFYVPGTNADLYRLREMISAWDGYTITSFFNDIIPTTSTPVAYLIMFLCEKTKVLGLLPLFCSAVFYWNCFHSIILFMNSRDTTPRVVAIILLIIMSPGMYLEVISDVRCFVALSIVSRCIIDEYLMNRSMVLNIIPYIVACLFHNAALVLVIIRLIVLLFDKKYKWYVYMVNIIVVLLILFAVFRFGGFYLDSAWEKAVHYLTKETYSYFWEYLIGAIECILFIIILYYYKKIHVNDNTIDKFWTIAFITLILELAFFWSYSIFHRFIVSTSILLIPVAFTSIKEMYNQEQYKNIRTIKLICLLMLFIACSRGNLSGFKFFVLS